MSPRLGAGAQLSPVEEENGHRLFFFFVFLNSSIRHKTTLPSTTFEHATKLYFQYPIL